MIERELEEAETASVVIQLTDVVAHSHDIGTIHRDIKPGNVMVQPDGTIKLLDFGAAKELREKEMSETVTGSRPYMAPEQIMGKSREALGRLGPWRRYVRALHGDVSFLS